MRPDLRIKNLLGKTRAKAKMLEFDVPEQYQNIDLREHPSKLFDFTIATLGDLSAHINGEQYITEDELADLHISLRLAAQFFESYSTSRLDESLDDFNILCASACFYLSDLPGSSNVLARHASIRDLSITASGLERVVLWLLQDDFDASVPEVSDSYRHDVELACGYLKNFRRYGELPEFAQALFKDLQKIVYRVGDPFELLFVDTLCAIANKRIEYSVWTQMPSYSELSATDWNATFMNESFMHELWPAQRLLGEKKVISGSSATLQMPTSAGKTKATELIIRSSFLAKRATLAVVVAPFRALCHEIQDDLAHGFKDQDVSVDEFTDVMQQDVDIAELLGHRQVVVTTPEKLNFVLRHNADFAENIGLLIYDEGHLFDDASRGASYELLLTDIKFQLRSNAQTLLISAVISNAEQVGKWLLGENSITVSGNNLSPTYRSIAFCSWITQLGQIKYLNPLDVEDYQFFASCVLRGHDLHHKTTGAVVARKFPSKTKPAEIALFLGMKLVPNGSVAVFCGQKASARKICEEAVYISERGVSLPFPINSSNQIEIRKLKRLIVRNFGEDSIAAKSAALGILSHHSNTPQGIRLAVEYAMKKGHACFVACTSTLAQGVNLPIRYLIVTSVYQGGDKIKVRDFHNLMGRVGRAGKHTEGTVIFADPKIYDKKQNWLNKWRWKQVKDLLDPDNSEDCASAIAEILKPFVSDESFNDDERFIIETNPLDLAELFLQGEDALNKFVIENVINHDEFSERNIKAQLNAKVKAIQSVQSYLLHNSEDWDDGDFDGVKELAGKTLAYVLADDDGKESLEDLFVLLATDISEQVPESNHRKILSRMVFGLRECRRIESWVSENLDDLIKADTQIDLLNILTDLLIKLVDRKSFCRCSSPEARSRVLHGWIGGESYGVMLPYLSDATIGNSPSAHHYKVEHVVDMTEGGLGYTGSLVIGAVSASLELLDGEFENLIQELTLLQRRVKYGLPTELSIILHELGFSDRVIAQELTHIISEIPTIRADVMVKLIEEQEAVRHLLEDYPAYYKTKFEALVTE